MFEYDFEKLDVYQESFELSKTIYALTKSFPNDEKYGLISQLRRAV